MFDRYVGSKTDKPNKWLGITVTTSVVLHVIGGAGLLIYSFWKIEKLPVKDSSILYMAAAASAPPPPPPPPPPPKRTSVKTEVKKTTTEVVQPPKDPPKEQPKEVASEEDEGEEGGVEGGVKGGVIGGVIGGELGGELGGDLGGTLDAPPPDDEPKTVAQAMIEGQRIAGNKNILLPDSLLSSLKVQGVSKLQTKVELCLDGGGAPSSIRFKKSSGYEDVDAVIKSAISGWKYKPYLVQGKAVPICVIVIVNHSIQ